MFDESSSSGFVNARIRPRICRFSGLDLCKILLDSIQFPEYRMVFGIYAVQAQISWRDQYYPDRRY